MGIRTVGFALFLVFLILAVPSTPVRAYTFPEFGDSIHDYAVDFDGDGDYDELRVDFTATVLENGTYGFEAILGTANNSYLLRDSFDKTLSAGQHPLTVKFLGPYVHKYDVDGPYTVVFRGSVVVGSVRLSGSQKSYSTSAYDAQSFDPPWAQFVGLITDHGRDTNGDGRFDRIAVETSVVTTKRVVVIAYASITAYGQDGWATVQSPIGDPRRLSKGTSQMEFLLDTLPLYTIHANGPYTVSLSLYAEGLGSIDYRSHVTQAYAHTSFRRPSADFGTPAPSVALVDPDDNGLADLLVVRVPLRVTESGDFLVYADLWLGPYSSGFFQSGRGAHLDPGNYTLTIPFSGISLSRAPASANWSVDVIINRLDSIEYDRNRTAWVMAGYDPSLFESKPVTYFDGRITWTGGPPHDGGCYQVFLMDPVTKFTTQTQGSVYRFFSIPAYDGNFLALAKPCGLGTSRALSVTVPATTYFEIPVGDAPARSFDVDLNLTAWTALRSKVRVSSVGEASEIRYFADFYGDRDGFADSAELRIIEHSRFRNFFLGEPPGRLVVDGRLLPFRSIEPLGMEGAGEVASTVDVSETLVVDYSTQLEPASHRHNVTLEVPYDSYYEMFRGQVELPVGSTGTVTSSGNVTIVPIGPAAWSIDPGTGPGTSFGTVDVYIEAIGPEGPGGGLGPVPTALLLVLALVAVIATVWWVRRLRRAERPEDPPPQEPKGDGT